jgi:hypothetical protein
MSAVESGNLLPILSLGGVVSKVGQGRQLDQNQINVQTATVLLLDNPKRISAILQNLGPTDVVISFPGSASGFTLAAYGNLQINRDFPWTGIVIGTSAVLTGVSVTEISVQ